MIRAFISYRRSDSLPTAARIADTLKGADAVRELFVDMDGIDYGQNFETQIQKKLASATVILILIGRDWLAVSGASGAARIFDEEDWVRREVSAALTSNKRIIPVLIDGATMPARTDLPDDLSGLPALNAFQLRNSHFHQDMDYLLQSMAGGKPAGTRWSRRSASVAGFIGRLALGFLISILLLMAVYLAGLLMTPEGCNINCVARDMLRLPTMQDAQRYVVPASIAVILAGTFLPPILYVLRATGKRR